MSKLIEKSVTDGPYGFDVESAIIEMPKHGRVYIQQGFGGIDQPIGGAVRWLHGIAVKVLDTDTLESLNNGRWNNETDLLDAVTHGYDKTRPVFEWSGAIIDKIATGLNL